jgi:sec-independent protein translocase protein TatA
MSEAGAAASQRTVGDYPSGTVFGDIIQPTHLLFILVVALLVLGPKRLPEVGRSLGKGIRDFRGAMAGIEDHAGGLLRDEPAPAPMPASQADPVTTAAPAPVAQTGASSEPDPGDYAD